MVVSKSLAALKRSLSKLQWLSDVPAMKLKGQILSSPISRSTSRFKTAFGNWFDAIQTNELDKLVLNRLSARSEGRDMNPMKKWELMKKFM
jgi:hypothetical protein